MVIAIFKNRLMKFFILFALNLGFNYIMFIAGEKSLFVAFRGIYAEKCINCNSSYDGA